MSGDKNVNELSITLKMQGEGMTRKQAKAAVRREQYLDGLVKFDQCDGNESLRPDLQMFVPHDVDLAISSNRETVKGWHEHGVLEVKTETNYTNNSVCYFEAEQAAVKKLVTLFLNEAKR